VNQIINHLHTVFLSVREYILKQKIIQSALNQARQPAKPINIPFETEKIVIDYLLNAFPKARLLSKEMGLINESVTDYDFHFIIDSISGLDNYLNGIQPVGFSIAVCEGETISTSSVTHGILGNIITGSFVTASKGQGVEGINPSSKDFGRVSPPYYMATCSINPFQPEQFLLFQSVNQVFKELRSYGCPAIELFYVVEGITSAHYDFRRELTAESFLAAALILDEMGGKLSDLEGNPVSDIENLTDRYSVVASHRAHHHLNHIRLLKEPGLYLGEWCGAKL